MIGISYYNESNDVEYLSNNVIHHVVQVLYKSENILLGF